MIRYYIRNEIIQINDIGFIQVILYRISYSLYIDVITVREKRTVSLKPDIQSSPRDVLIQYTSTWLYHLRRLIK